MNYVKELEGRSNSERADKLQSILESAGLETKIQECHHPRIKNFILDFAPHPQKKSLLFSAHYDAVKNRPAANDNASGVAVLLGLCQQLKRSPAPVRVVFFDREEAWLKTPWLRMGLLGSLYYVSKTDLKDIAAVYNLEFCGLGDSLAAWPIKNSQKNLPALQQAAKAARHLDLKLVCAHFPWLLLSSDHLSFRFKGLANALTLSLLPAAQVPLFEALVSELNLVKLLIGRRPALPGILSIIHGLDDVSANLEESSLQRMLSVLIQMIDDFALVQIEE
jgi:hypothetical protein